MIALLFDPKDENEGKALAFPLLSTEFENVSKKVKH